MSVTDLTGTRWYFNDTLSPMGSTLYYVYFKDAYNVSAVNVQFYYNSNFSYLAYMYNIPPSTATYQYSVYKYSDSSWKSWTGIRDIEFWGGRDATNPNVIAWIESNATQLSPRDYLTNIYDLAQVGHAIRSVTGTSALLSYPSAMVNALNNIGDFWTIEQLMSTDSLGDLYYDGSRTTIPDWAFTYKNINTAEFPNVLAIGSSAFYSDYLLSTISFPKVLSIGSAAFNRCYKLTTASFPSCISIGNNAFYNCSSLTTVSFPNCISIGGLAFYGCSSLTTVSFPNCTSIGLYAFQSCVRLMTVSFPSCISISSYAFSNCTSLTIAPFPKCTFIGSSAFYNCYSLTIASFPECGSIGNYAFNQCYNLISLNLTEVSSVPALDGSYTFLSTPIGGYSASAGQYGSIYVPASLYDAFTSATNWTYFSSRMVSV